MGAVRLGDSGSQGHSGWVMGCHGGSAGGWVVGG